MMRLIQFLIILFLTLGLVSDISSQAELEAQAQEELKELGHDEDEVKRRMLEKGIDLDNVNTEDPLQVLEAEKTLKVVIAELEAEKLLKNEKLIDTIVPLLDVEKISIEENTKPEKVPEKEAEKITPKSNIFGQHIFQNKNLSYFQSSAELNVPDTYVLGVGDKIAVSIWGRSQLNEIHEISSDGSIALSNRVRVNLRGLNVLEAKRKLEKTYSNYYRFNKGEFAVDVSQTRNININIVGEVLNYGSFNLSATNNIFNALILAGGPTKIGSVRNISLIRPGEDVRKIDLYDYLLNENKPLDLYLMENDIINVPVANRLIEITGAVRRPFIYELKKGENLKEIISFSGGLKSNAIKRNITIKRFINDIEIIQNVNLEELLSSSKNFTLLDGDKITVNSVPKEYENFVNISGAVDVEGNYAISDNTQLIEVLKRVQIQSNALTSLAYIKRKEKDKKNSTYIFINIDNVISNPQDKDNIILQPGDEIVIYSQARYVDEEFFSVEGAVREPSEFILDNNGKISVDQAIYLAGGLRKDATDFAYIKRRDTNNAIEYIRIDLNNAQDRPILKSNDILHIYSSIDYTDESFVSIGGAVRQPGQFQYDESLRLKDLITLSGGLKMESAPYRIDIYRLNFDDKNKSKTLAATVAIDKDFSLFGQDEFLLNPFDQVYVRNAPEFEFQRTVQLEGEIKFQGPYALLKDNERVSSIIERAGGPTKEAFLEGATLFRVDNNMGYVILNLNEALSNKNSNQNILLKAGDIISIPKNKDLVTILGESRVSELYSEEITNQGKINVAFHKNKNAKFYIDEYAGGVGKNGKKDLITVTYPSGEVKRATRFLFWHKYPEVKPGSIIRIGKKPIKPKDLQSDGTEEKTDWSKVVADSIGQATAILSLILLLQRVD